MSYIIRHFTSSDIDAVVNLHLECFKGFFLSKLGVGFLKLYYKVYLKPDYFSFVAVENDIVIGFVFGYKNGVQFNQDLKRQSINFAIPLLFSVFKPSVYKELIYKLRNVIFRGGVNQKYIQPINVYELSSLGVSTSCRGKGVGAVLVNKFTEFALENGANGICIITDKLNNKNTISFYKALNFTEIQEFSQGESRKMLVLARIF